MYKNLFEFVDKVKSTNINSKFNNKITKLLNTNLCDCSNGGHCSCDCGGGNCY